MTRLLRTTLATVLLATGVLLALSATTQAAVPGSGSDRAFLVGHLGFEGGPYPGGFHPTAGDVEVAFSINPLVLEVPVGKTGRFRIPLSPGTYTVTGCGPSSSAVAAPRCGRSRTVTLTAGQEHHIRLVWMYAP